MKQKVWITGLALCILSVGVLTGCGENKETSTKNDNQPKLTVKRPIEPHTTNFSKGEGYVGSEVCGDCHVKEYAVWKETKHSKIMQEPGKHPEAILGDFSMKGNPTEVSTYKKEDIIYTIGSKNLQRYLVKDGDAIRVLPAQWIVAENKWVPYEPKTWMKEDFKDKCISCHVTGYDMDSRSFKESVVGCESCHGPGEKHAKDGKLGNILNPKTLSKQQQTDLCGQCHVTGKNKNFEGRDDAYGFMPGDKLSDHYVPVTPKSGVEDEFFHADGNAKLLHSQYNDLVQSKMYQSGMVSCVTCHSPKVAKAPYLRSSTGDAYDLCVSCHSDAFGGIKKEDFDLTKFMPMVGQSAVPGDKPAHTFRMPQ